MHDRTPTGEQQDTTVDGDRTDRTGQDATVTVPEAAQILGVSTDAVRSRLRRGTLEGVKIAGEWHVPLRILHGSRQDAQPSPTGPRQDATGDRQAGQQAPDRIATVMDVAPLAELIDDLARRNADLAATAAMWQFRARQLEDQLKQLSAGEIVHQTIPEPPRSPETNDTGLRGAWHRLRRRLGPDGGS
jgi:hypothetical protein